MERELIGDQTIASIGDETATIGVSEIAPRTTTFFHGGEPAAATDCDQRLKRLGIYTPDMLRRAIEREAKRPYLVEGLLRRGSVNLLVGNSGIGKTPLAIQIGLCVAAGIPLFGRAAQKGPVLYCDAESGRAEFWEMLAAISRFLGLHEPPADFHVWSPNWEDTSKHDPAWWTAGVLVSERVREVQPALIIADAFRTFWPNAETKNKEAADTFASMRKDKGTWLVLHHLRKPSQQPGGEKVDLVEDPHAWFREAAGAHAIVNHSDTRIGVEVRRGEIDLILSGFMRGTGLLTPLELARAFDDDGNPVGYRLLTGIDRLNPDDRAVFDKLGATCRFKDVMAAFGGTSGSNPARFLDRCQLLQIIRKDGSEYVKVKTAPKVEAVE
jgi:hypothetical protein